MTKILRPIDEVVNYVSDAHTWPNWRLDLIGEPVYVDQDTIKATYLSVHEAEYSILWRVARDTSAKPQKVTFTNTADEKVAVHYTFTVKGGAATDVERDGDRKSAADLLSKLKKALESGSHDPIRHTTSGHGPP